MILDDWQIEVLGFSGDCLLCTGRRVGKTYILSRKAIDYMAAHRRTPVVIVSLTEDQAMIIMGMALAYAKQNYPRLIGRGRERPTMKSLHLNGGRMIVRPVGNTGDGARGFEGGILIVDEAARMPKLFWLAAKPILLTTNGQIWMSSTPFGKEGYFWERYDEAENKKIPNARFKVFSVSSEEVMENRKICGSWTEEQRIGALRILEEDKKEMSAREYAQEYLGRFVEELLSFFPEELIERACILEKKGFRKEFKHYLGVDVGGLGEDKSTFEIISKISSERLEQADSQITRRKYTTETTRKILELEAVYKFKKIGIDNAGIGAGVFHPLLFETSTKNKIVGLQNAQKNLDKEGKRKATLLKEDMYCLMKALMEQGKLLLLRDEEVINSLRNMQQEILISPNQKSRLRIFGSNSHVTEGIVRGVWVAYEDKSLNIFVR